MANFKNIGITGRPSSAQVVDTLKRLTNHLLKSNCNVFMGKDSSPMIPGHHIPVLSRQEMGPKCDLAIVVGGDGSMLNAARAFAGTPVSVLGINRGTLGFLTDIAADQVETQIDKILAGHYTEEKRFLLHISIRKKDTAIEATALNEIILHPTRFGKMITFELFIDNQFVMSQRSDGMIIATPTGSTAYALSAGGPIMHPSLEAISLIPMYPHTLSNRPLVVDSKCYIMIKIGVLNTIFSQISCDGQNFFSTQPGNTLYIKQHEAQLKLIHPLGYNHYIVCRKKLGWGHRLDQ